MDRLEAMTVFVAVAELRGFAPAARQLGISPSAVTRMVAGLEDILSISLLQRTTRIVTLTEAGARYLESAKQILSAVTEAEANARAQNIQPSGRFVVAAPLMFGRLLVAPLLTEYSKRFKLVRPVLTLGDRLVNILEEGVDVAVRIGVLDDSSLKARHVGKTQRVIVASPEYLKIHKHPKGVSDLSKHNIIQFTGLNPIPEWRFDWKDGEKRFIFQPAFVTNSADVAIAHAEANGGLVMVLSYQVAEQIRSGRLELVLPNAKNPQMPIQIVYPATRLVSANVRAFIDLTIATQQWNW